LLLRGDGAGSPLALTLLDSHINDLDSGCDQSMDVLSVEVDTEVDPLGKRNLLANLSADACKALKPFDRSAPRQ
jgi:hypothetical protein